jgi:hypothetical protein
MIEDFDNIFKDKIGDELPYDFRPGDWLAAEQELDKLMPLAAPIAPSPRFLTWHKWAIAATILLLGSQLYLMTELSKVKQEVVTLHEENKGLITAKKANKSDFNTPQAVVIQHDTLVKTVFIEVPQKGQAAEQSVKGKEIQRRDFDNFADNKNSINERNEAVSSNAKNNKATPPKTNFAPKINELNTENMALKTVENAKKIEVKKDVLKDANNVVINKNELADINRENANKSVETNKENADNLNQINKENANNSLENKKENNVLNTLPNNQLALVKSINRAKNWLDDAAFDFILTSKPVIIKPITEPNGWEISANALLLTNEEHRRPHLPHGSEPDDQKASIGANLRLSYNLKSNIRLSADADFWSERHGQDTTGRPQILPKDFTLTGVEQTFRSFQLRVGADYKFRQIIGIQPFIGLGLAYQKRSNDGFEFVYKKDNNKLPPIAVPNETKFDKPLFISLRAGLEGKIYRRLSWSVDVNGQRGVSYGQTWSSHFGLKYAL